jgi:hypothetical protein
MCVTNTTGRRPQPLSFGPAQIALCQSPLSQRLLGSVTPTPLSSSPQAPYFTQRALSPEQNVCEVKTRPRRRRKPQQPGKTAKNYDRHFVVHHYHDHALDQDHCDEEGESLEDQHRRRGGVSVPFPVKLHEVLDQVEVDGFDHVMSWQAHGRCFVIHKPKEFVDYVMPK